MYGRWIILFAIPAAIMCMPVPDGLTREAWNVFAVYAAAIIGLIFKTYRQWLKFCRYLKL